MIQIILTAKRSFLVLLLLISIQNNLYCQENKLGYLKNNSSAITISNEANVEFGSMIFNEKYKIYLSGELHGEKNNLILQYGLLKELFEKGKINCLISEYPYSFGLFVKQFLKSGDEKDLNFILDYMPDKVDQKKEYFQLFYSYYNNIDKTKRFSLEFIGDEPDNALAVEALMKMLPIDETPQELSKPIKELKLIDQKKKYSNKEIVAFLKDIEACFVYEEVFAKYIGKNVFDFKRIVQGLHVGITSNGESDSKTLEKREQFMYKNIKELYNKDSNLYCFGQFGRLHIPREYQKNWMQLREWKSLGARLNTNEESPVKNNVCSIAYFYPPNMRYETKFHLSIISKEDIPLFLELSPTSLTMFKIDNQNTPFKEMAKKFQYIVINKY